MRMHGDAQIIRYTNNRFCVKIMNADCSSICRSLYKYKLLHCESWWILMSIIVCNVRAGMWVPLESCRFLDICSQRWIAPYSRVLIYSQHRASHSAEYEWLENVWNIENKYTALNDGVAFCFGMLRTCHQIYPYLTGSYSNMFHETLDSKFSLASWILFSPICKEISGIECLWPLSSQLLSGLSSSFSTVTNMSLSLTPV